MCFMLSFAFGAAGSKEENQGGDRSRQVLGWVLRNVSVCLTQILCPIYYTEKKAAQEAEEKARIRKYGGCNGSR